MSSLYTINEQITMALRDRNFAEAEKCLQQGADINWRNVRGETPAFFFSNSHALNALNWLISKGADLEIPNINGDTPLMSAVLRNDAIAVGALLDGGADVNRKNSRNIAPLMQAVLVEKDHGVLTRLLEANPDLDPVSETSTTPLLAAAGRGKANYVMALLDAGADPEATDYLGLGLLHAALNSFEGSLVTQILDRIPYLDPNYASRSGTSAMSLAMSCRGGTHLLEKMLDMGGDPNAISQNRMNEGVTLLMSTLAYAQSDLPEKAQKDAAGAIQEIIRDYASPELIEKMLKMGARVNDRDTGGRSVAFYAMYAGSTSTLIKLLAYGVDPSRPLSPGGTTVYDFVSYKRNIDTSTEDGIMTCLAEIDKLVGAGFPISRPEWDEKIDGAWTSEIEEKFQPLPTVLQTYLNLEFIPGLLHLIQVHNADVNEVALEGTTLAHSLIKYNGMSGATKAAIALASRSKKIDPVERDRQIEELNLQAKEKLEEVRKVVSGAGIDWTKGDREGHTPLHHAVFVGSKEWIKYLLLEQKVDPTIRSKDGLTVAGLALMKGDVETFVTLIEVARSQGHDLLKGVLGDVVQACSDDFRERQPMLQAIAMLDSTKDMWKNEINRPNTEHQTPLYLACATDQHDVVRTLLKLQADPNIPDEQGNTPLMQATYLENGEAIRMLRAAGGKVEQRNNAGQNALDVALYVKQAFLHRALEEDNLQEIILDLMVKEKTTEEKEMDALMGRMLDAIPATWINGQAPDIQLPALTVDNVLQLEQVYRALPSAAKETNEQWKEFIEQLPELKKQALEALKKKYEEEQEAIRRKEEEQKQKDEQEAQEKFKQQVFDETIDAVEPLPKKGRQKKETKPKEDVKIESDTTEEEPARKQKRKSNKKYQSL